MLCSVITSGDSIMNETKEKRMISRDIALAISLILLVLVVGSTAGWVATYLSNVSLNNKLADKENTISSLNEQNLALQQQVGDLNDTLNGGKVTTWVNNTQISQPPNGSTIMNFTPSYYGTVIFEADTKNNVSMSGVCAYPNNPPLFNETVSASAGALGFLVGRLTNVTITITNNDANVIANETLSVWFYY